MMLSKKHGTLQTKHCDLGSCAIIRRRSGPELVYRDANVLMVLVLTQGARVLGFQFPRASSFHFFWLHVVPFLKIRTYWAKLCVLRTKHSVSLARRGTMA